MPENTPLPPRLEHLPKTVIECVPKSAMRSPYNKVEEPWRPKTEEELSKCAYNKEHRAAFAIEVILADELGREIIGASDIPKADFIHLADRFERMAKEIREKYL